MGDLGQIKALRKSGNEQFNTNGDPLPMTLNNFWQWSASDVVANTMRGALAEYIVGCAIDAKGIHNETREEWGAYDLTDCYGNPVEVKSSAYIQSWYQKGYSKISFLCPKTKKWNPETSKNSEEAFRQAYVYVFAILHHKDQETLDPLNTDQWEFYVLPTFVLDERKRSQYSITLNSLKKIHGEAVAYHQLKDAVSLAAEKHRAHALLDDGSKPDSSAVHKVV